MFSEPWRTGRGAGGSSGRNTCLWTRAHCSRVQEVSPPFHRWNWGSPSLANLFRVTQLACGGGLSVKAELLPLEWLIHQARLSFEYSGIGKVILNTAASPVFTFNINGSNIGQCHPSRVRLEIFGPPMQGWVLFLAVGTQRSGMLRHAAMLKTFYRTKHHLTQNASSFLLNNTAGSL